MGITLTLFGGTSLLTGAIDPKALSGIIAIVFGAGYFASGFISGMTWLTRVGAAWWGGGLVLLVWSPPDTLLLLAGLTLALAVAPALRLRQIERDSTRPV